MIEKAIILSAGQGKRLLPLTEQRPKCLLPLGGRTLLEWQIAALAANGIREVVVVTGFHTDTVEAVLVARPHDGVRVRTLYNPFFQVADNVGSCFVARHEMIGNDFVLLNGDTLFHPSLYAAASAQDGGPITVTVDRKERYDSDDMKVHVGQPNRLLAIGKDLEPERADAESIGMLFFRRNGGTLFTDALERVMRRDNGLKQWYLRVVNELAATVPVGVAPICGHEWCEVDFPKDLAAAETLATKLWRERLGNAEAQALCSSAP